MTQHPPVRTYTQATVKS